MDKYYAVNIGSTAPVYFDSAYTGGQASAKFNGTVVIYTKNEGFEDAGNAAGETAHMVSSDFGSGLMAVLMTRYARNENANPNEYVPDKSELITAVNEYAVKNGYGIMNIDYINVEITAEKVVDTMDDVEYVPSITEGNDTQTDVAKPIETQPVTITPTPEEKEISVAPILAITFGFLLVVAVVVIVILAKGNKSKATPAAPVVPEAPVEPEMKEEKPEEAKPEEKKE